VLLGDPVTELEGDLSPDAGVLAGAGSCLLQSVCLAVTMSAQQSVRRTEINACRRCILSSYRVCHWKRANPSRQAPVILCAKAYEQ
jgi:hypothetical protein